MKIMDFISYLYAAQLFISFTMIKVFFDLQTNLNFFKKLFL